MAAKKASISGKVKAVSSVAERDAKLKKSSSAKTFRMGEAGSSLQASIPATDMNRRKTAVRQRADKSNQTERNRYTAGAVLSNPTRKPESRMTTMEKMQVTQQGISKKQLEQLKKKAVLDYDQLSYILGVARATLIAKKGSAKFSSLLSEKIMSLADIYSYGYEVFGSEEEFNEWIFQPIAAFAGKMPYDVLNNQYGREEVLHVIGRIAYGVYS